MNVTNINNAPYPAPVTTTTVNTGYNSRRGYSAVSSFLSLICCAALIALIVIGVLCIEQFENPHGGFCGPAGRTGGIAMLTVGGVLLGAQILFILCLFFTGASIGFLAGRESQPH